TRAALTTIDIILEDGLVERSAELGRHMLGRMQDLMARSPHVGDVRGRGLMVGVELVEDRASRQPARDLAERVFYACLEQRLSFKVSQGNVLTLSPPLVISKTDLDRALDIVEAAVLAA
ncbi:aminotransferase class III-fold pyridoxal phosphate-dependent enzyme, partial [Mesorhizobium sp. M8A.F.Ca.ET.023.02.2.1]